MSKLIPLYVLFALFSNPAQAQEDMLVGEISVSELKEAPYSEWFIDGYDTYNVKDAVKDELAALLDGVHITIFMGTWCSDSQREVPHFYKILDVLEFPFENSELVAMERDKTTPDQLEEGLNIQRVPTFIFYKDDKELGRIVEYPITSLEADMIAILSGLEYEHAYAQ
ncbi:MAG: thioredoxin family protein [Pricia sp.]